MSTRSIVNKRPVDIIIPTMDNLDQLLECLESMYQTRLHYPMRFIIVNNGEHPLERYLPQNHKDFVVVKPGRNLGWTGGIAEGLKHSDSEFVLFANDDIFIPQGSVRWLSQMTRHLIINKRCGMVGPVSNVVMGSQNMWHKMNFACHLTSFLIGFCVMVRRSTLDEVGGIDEDFATGDDIDLSIRMTKNHYFMMVDRTIFVWHHGFRTGEKIYGRPDKPGGWNSQKMTDDTNIHLIKKHGFLEWWYTRVGYPDDYHASLNFGKERFETELVLGHLNGCAPSDIVDLGCGGSKTVEGSVGVDILPVGEQVPNTAFKCQADIQADVSLPMPMFEDGRFKTVIARHVLEHCTDTVGALEEWRRIMADDGRMIIAVPDERISDTIILNPEHVHAFTPDTLSKLADRCGLKTEHVDEFYTDDSFILVCSKKGACA